jgi:hypothetical protein
LPADRGARQGLREPRPPCPRTPAGGLQLCTARHRPSSDRAGGAGPLADRRQVQQRIGNTSYTACTASSAGAATRTAPGSPPVRQTRLTIDRRGYGSTVNSPRGPLRKLRAPVVRRLCAA